tara:strand:- start:858 stop:1115 length:258 start_codon:yes stop_codon:yes gene_type:complete
MSISPFLSKMLLAIAKPFIAKKLTELQDTNERAHPGQASSQVAKIGIGGSLAMLTQVDSVEATAGMIAVLLINIFFLYYPENNGR